MNKPKIDFNKIIDNSEFISFIEANSENDFDEIIEMLDQDNWFNNSDLEFLRYDNEIEENYTNSNSKFLQEMVNKFFKAYKIDKEKYVAVYAD